MYLKLELPNDNILNVPGIRVRTWIELNGDPISIPADPRATETEPEDDDDDDDSSEEPDTPPPPPEVIGAGIVFQRNALNLPCAWPAWVKIRASRAEFRKIVEFSHMSRPTPGDIEDWAISRKYIIEPYCEDPFKNGDTAVCAP